MKKAISLILIVMLLLGAMFTMASCGENPENGDEETVKISILVSQSANTETINGVKDAIQRLKSDLGVKVSYIVCKNDAYAKKELLNAAEGSRIVFAIGDAFYEIGEVSTHAPLVNFVWIGNSIKKIEDYNNLACINYSTYSAAKVAGYIAAKLADSGSVFMLTDAQDDATAMANNEFYQGVLEYSEDITVNNSCIAAVENDESVLKLATGLYKNGVDVIYYFGNEYFDSVAQAAKDTGYYLIANGFDAGLVYKDFKDVIPCSVVYKISQTIYDICSDDIKEYTFPGGEIVIGEYTNDYVGIAYNLENDSVDDDFVEDVESKIYEFIHGVDEPENPDDIGDDIEDGDDDDDDPFKN